MFRNLYDSHTHSEHSPDGRDSVLQIARNAMKNGFAGVAVTDHCECNLLERFHYRERLAHTARDVRRAREALGERFSLTLGIELAEVYEDYDMARAIVAAHPFDFVLGSVHEIEGYSAYFINDYEEMRDGELEEMLRAYFAAQTRFVLWGEFDALAHIALPLRYLKLYSNIEVDLRLFTEELDELLRALVEKGVGLEVNVSGLRRGEGRAMPPVWVLRRYRELGGEIVTIGSDAHTAVHVGSGIAEGMQMLTAAGFRHFAFFRERKPVMLRIE